MFLSRFVEVHFYVLIDIGFACCIKLCVLECVWLIVLLTIRLMWSVNCVIYVIYEVWRCLGDYDLILEKLWFLSFKRILWWLLEVFYGFVDWKISWFRRVYDFDVWWIFIILILNYEFGSFMISLDFREKKFLWFVISYEFGYFMNMLSILLLNSLWFQYWLGICLNSDLKLLKSFIWDFWKFSF